MQSFTHVFVGIGGTGARIVNSITADGIVKVTVNPAYYLLPNSNSYEDRLRNFFSRLPRDTFLWLVFEDKDINHELREIITESAPGDTIKLAYVLTPRKELVEEKKPSWAREFETVFYDSLWDFFSDENVSLVKAFERASANIAEMFSRLYYYLETQMLVNIDYADLFNMIRGGNVGILRLLREVDFTWHWGIWERGLIGILVGSDFPLRGAHSILRNFQEVLSEKDIIWGVITDESLNGRVEILALLVKKW
ncbi:hypothetical protein CL1_0364 [Thermococcus cleftensis]|uniref:Uncharacterized protein n=1 Tax=Thermococcus cleftensis (strain DSM 27260 / KACC 17922 / CL1) TaxID=163003 RepID=I3ZS91_THECF|nr:MULTISPECIES: hypothetical protein [Thermococcus]AFL94575.1 hypothetical protein CL1_0364 [Thermococcus cleftensis]NJE03397.1 hypothetical protein [Thermococcus sp. MV11]